MKKLPPRPLCQLHLAIFRFLSGTTMAGEDFLLWQSASRHILVLATGCNIKLMATR
ncbi:hypothetical protein T12_16475 [Trichinella patagoniensis]|uniref:Uncharacterized protein n=1 Tax=Trichinella patagoniensis TaxID=990121 RepID=A0A0V0YXI7_9BILA|nr:hypothetical protein T12_16475 [Trichinella patagoniensis]